MDCLLITCIICRIQELPKVMHSLGFVIASKNSPFMNFLAGHEYDAFLNDGSVSFHFLSKKKCVIEKNLSVGISYPTKVVRSCFQRLEL